MDSDTIIRRLGGTSAVAELCQVRAPSVSEWRKKGIPKARLMFLRAVRPDIFGDPPVPNSRRREARRKEARRKNTAPGTEPPQEAA